MKLEQSKPVQIDDMHFRPEVVSKEIKRDAMLYVLIRGGPTIPLDLDTVGDWQSRPSSMTKGWEYDSPYRSWMPVASDIGEWQYEFLTFPAEAYEPFMTDVKIRGDRRLRLSDFHYGCMTMVRPAVREMIEDIDPDRNYFLPVKVFDRDTSELITAEYAHWLPRRRMWYLPKVDHPPDQRLRVHFENRFSDPSIAWQLTYNEGLRQFVREIPFWALESFPQLVAISATAFRRFKAEGSTGLQENMADDTLDRNYNENSGHF